MPRYFFDFHDHQANIDDVGTECPDIASVRREANVTLAQVVRDIVSGEGPMSAFSVVVRDEMRRVVYTATLTLSELWVEKPAS